MKAFSFGGIKEALEHAAAGGQALHLFDPRPFVRRSTPRCFRSAKEAAHLFDADAERLEATAKRLGVRVVKIERRGQRRGQHVDLIGAPLRKAKAEAEVEADVEGMFG